MTLWKNISASYVHGNPTFLHFHFKLRFDSWWLWTSKRYLKWLFWSLRHVQLVLEEQIIIFDHKLSKFEIKVSHQLFKLNPLFAIKVTCSAQNFLCLDIPKFYAVVFFNSKIKADDEELKLGFAHFNQAFSLITTDNAYVFPQNFSKQCKLIMPLDNCR